jgi:hypothetical protein
LLLKSRNKEQKMKNTFKCIAVALLVLATVGCSNIITGTNSRPGEGTVPGTGLVSLSLNQQNAARAIAQPASDSLYYTLAFTAEGKDPVNNEIAGGSTAKILLAIGTWDLEVRAYISKAAYEADPEEYGLIGTAAGIAVTEGGTTSVPIALSAKMGGWGSGSLHYKVSYPDGAAKATLSFTPIFDDFAVPEINLIAGGDAIQDGVRTNEGVLDGANSLSSGYYRALAAVSKVEGGELVKASKIAVVHIYDNLQSDLELAIGADDFSGITVIDSLTALDTFLLGAPPNAKDNPYEIALKPPISLAELGNGDYGLGNLTPHFYGKYVSLDLGALEPIGTLGANTPSYSTTYPLNWDKLVSLVLPDGITTIGQYCFYNMANLKTVVLPADLVTIGQCAFQNCSPLEMPEWPETLTTINANAFSGTNLSGELKLPSTVTSLGTSAFRQTAGITKADLSNLAITVIPNFILERAASLQVVVLPDGTISIGSNAFTYCTSLASVNFGDLAELTTIGGSAFAETALASLTLGSTVTTISASAFWSGDNNTMNNTLQTVDLSACENLTVISASMFKNCAALSSVKLPPHLATVTISTTMSAFFGSPNIVFDVGSSGFTTLQGGKVLIDPTGKLVYGHGATGALELPAAVTEIAPYAFHQNGALTSVGAEAGSALTKIGASAFYKNTALAGVDLGNCASLTTLENGAFADCAALAAVTLPENLATIGPYVFQGAQLTAITLHRTLATMDSTAFSSNTKPMAVTFPSDLALTGLTSAFFPAGSTLTITGSGGSYSSTGGFVMSGTTLVAYTGAAEDLAIPLTVTAISASAFAGNAAIKKVDMSGAPITAIGANAFAGTTLEEVKLPSALTTNIADTAFAGLTTLAKVLVPGDLNNARITYLAFAGCTNVIFEVTAAGTNYATEQGGKILLKGTAILAAPGMTGALSLANPAAITEIGPSAFKGSGIAAADLSGFTSLASIGVSAFENCTALASISLPAGLTTLALSSLRNTAIEELDLSGIAGTLAMGSNLVADCPNLKTLKLPPTFSGSSTYNYFRGAANLESVVIPAGLAAGRISYYNFLAPNVRFSIAGANPNYSIGAEGVAVMNGDGTILFAAPGASGAFTLPASVTEIAENVFQNNKALTTVVFNNALVKIGDYAFGGSGLTTLTLPASLESISIFAFQNCTSLRWVKWPASAAGAYIGRTSTAIDSSQNNAFNGCTALVKVELPDNLAGIWGRSAFAGAASLTTVILRNPSAITAIHNQALDVFWAFSGTPESLKFYVPESMQSLYAADPVWSARCGSQFADVATLSDTPDKWD